MNSASASDDPFVGKQVREYQILELLGRGGMGAVYRARHVLLQEERAIKVVRSGHAADDAFVQRFIREARVLSRLKDDHLVRLFEFWEGDGTLFMALELLRGESVARRLETRGRLSVRESVAIAADAARGLAAAHEHSIVHRDISPDNLQLVPDGRGGELVKVMDFGIAKAIEDVQPGLTGSLFLGKLEYASPEQCGLGIDEDMSIDSRSDIYSLGVTLFRMVTGQLPFASESPQGFLLKHASEPPRQPSSVLPDAGIPAELDRVILKALAKRRADRHGTMAELIAELEAVPIPDEAPPTAVLQQQKTIAVPEKPTEVAPRPTTGARTRALEPGDTFARRYVIQGQLGEGGMGIVYRALDTILDEPVALKLISARIAAEGDSLERLKREVLVARRVSHPNVCRIFDINESDGVHYVSMELIDGHTLNEAMRDRGPMSPTEALPIALQVLEALAAAHRVNVIHRDLKPDNVMITRDGHAIIMDFGLSMAVDTQRMTQAGSVLGTPHYMAPEQVAGVGVDQRSDLYAVGVILFRMVVGRLPFDSTRVAEVLRAQLQDPPPRPSELIPGFPPALEEILLRVLEKKPEARYASAEDLLAAIAGVDPATLEGRPAGSATTVAGVRPAKLVGRFRSQGAAAGRGGATPAEPRRPRLRGAHLPGSRGPRAHAARDASAPGRGRAGAAGCRSPGLAPGPRGTATESISRGDAGPGRCRGRRGRRGGLVRPGPVGHSRGRRPDQPGAHPRAHAAARDGAAVHAGVPADPGQHAASDHRTACGDPDACAHRDPDPQADGAADPRADTATDSGAHAGADTDAHACADAATGPGGDHADAGPVPGRVPAPGPAHDPVHLPALPRQEPRGLREDESPRGHLRRREDRDRRRRGDGHHHSDPGGRVEAEQPGRGDAHGQGDDPTAEGPGRSVGDQRDRPVTSPITRDQNTWFRPMLNEGRCGSSPWFPAGISR
jgi:serine/threonine protein kinase